MVNYQNGKIYKIVCNITGDIYVGSTTLALSQRLADHRFDYAKYQKGQHMYMTSFDITERGDFAIILLENVPCNNREELLMRERHYFDTVDCINRLKPYVSKEEAKCKRYEWNHKHAETVRDYKKKYRENHIEQLKEKSKQRDKTKRREYYDKTIEHKKQYDKERRENQRITCECGNSYIASTNNMKVRHELTQKHQNYLAQKEQSLMAAEDVDSI